MKNKFCFLLLLSVTLALPFNGFSQYVNVFGGIKLLDFKSSNIQLAYHDESPDPDYFYSNIDADGSMIYNIGASVDGFKHTKNIYYDLTLNLFLGNKYFGGDINASVGYPLYVTKKKTITVLPTVSVGYGLSDRSMGKLVNNTVYIQVNETRFKDFTDVDVSLSRSYVSLRPAVNFMFDLSKKLQIRLNAAYLFPIYTANNVKFSGKDNDDKAVSDTEDFDAPNLFFKVNGNETKESPIDIKGFEFRIGFAFNFGKNNKPEAQDINK
ncbi:MAG: hypothetical protein K8I03_09875 [Ignavibacteria bacterium]|nr:hypothetical protein [Ignavibacteria bacterium]